MAKRRFTISATLPAYAPPRNEWRRRVHAAMLEAQTFRGVGYRENDQLELRVSLYGPRELDIHEVDERTKDIVDALEGRIAGRRSRRRIAPIVSTGQVRRLVLEHQPSGPRRGRPFGLVTIARYRRRA